MEDDLEAELLAVTGDPSRERNRVESEGELSENFYSGDSESEVEDVEELSDTFERDQDENVEESDEEFVPGSSRKSKTMNRKGAASESTKRERSAVKASLSSKRPRFSNQSHGASRRGKHVENKRELFEDGYDEFGFGDEEDIARLMKLSEVEREAILAERLEKREQLSLERDLKRRMGEEKEEAERSSRIGASASAGLSRDSERTRKKRAALESLALQKGRRQQRYRNEDYLDGELESESEGSWSYESSETEDMPKRSSKRQELRKDIEERRKPITYSDIVDESGRTTPIFYRRQMLEMFVSKPYFDKMIAGMFARLSVGSAPGNPTVPIYRLVRIAGTHERDPRYKIGNIYTNKRIVCLFGSVKGEFSIERFSNKHPTQAEFDRWMKQMIDDRETVPTKEDVHYLLSLALDYRRGRVKVTDEEMQKHIEKFEKLNPERINYVTKKNDIITQIMTLRDNGASAEEIAKYENKLVELEKLEAKYHRNRLETTVDNRLKSLARKAREENARIDSEKNNKQLAEDFSVSSFNPFSRKATRGNLSYFTIERKPSETDLLEVKSQNNLSLETTNAIDAAIETVNRPKEEAEEQSNPVEVAQHVQVSLDDLFEDNDAL
eukprot:jgi/Galph1/5592/GphlegSOOS_G4264.1